MPTRKGKGKRKDPALKRLPPKRSGGGLLGTTVERVLAVRAPTKKRHGRNADDKAVVLSYREYPSGRRSRGSVKVIDAEDAYQRYEKK